MAPRERRDREPSRRCAQSLCRARQDRPLLLDLAHHKQLSCQHHLPKVLLKEFDQHRGACCALRSRSARAYSAPRRAIRCRRTQENPTSYARTELSAREKRMDGEEKSTSTHGELPLAGRGSDFA